MSDPTHPESRPVSHQYELAVLGEECGEAIQIVGKTLRFGYESYDPNDKTKETNLDLLHKELGDVLAAIDFAVERGLLDREKLVTRQFYKRRHLMKVAPPDTLLLTQRVGPAGEVAMQAVASAPHMVPTPQPGTIKPSEKRAIGVVVGVIVLIALFICGVNWLVGESTNRLEALRAYDECVTRNTADPSACDALARAAGEEPMPSHQTNVVSPETETVPDIGAGADDVVAGSR